MKTIDITLGEAARGGILSILEEIRPSWARDKIIIKSLKGGHVNCLYYCGLSDDAEEVDVLVCRIFSQAIEGITSREKEILVMRIAHQVDLAANIYCRFNNGIVYKYHKGVEVGFTNQTEESFARSVAKELAKVHVIDYNKILAELGEVDKASMFTGRFSLVGCLPMLLASVPDFYDDPEKEKIRVDELMAKADVQAEVNRLDEAICTMHFPVVLCHNDLNTGNIVYNKTEGSTHFVDWEVSGLNFAISDISSFFISHVYKYGTKCNPDQLKFYPDKEYQMKWIRWYLEYKAELCAEDPLGVTDDQVYTMYVGTNLAAMCYALCVGQWCLLQDLKPLVPVDYFTMGRQLQLVYGVIKRQLDQECCKISN